MKTKIFIVAALLLASVTFATEQEPGGGTCTLDPEGTCECLAVEGSNGTITGYKCDKAVSNPVIGKCVCP